ncbi:transcriptional regulator, MerR family [Aeromicrobium marinum DSM 15272]|uniref:Transcriptional regulator, MerR family n=1 Tax=Aeromicrobium marinum DSM 15272 TaxID=585531 RepID=E2S8H3_9ACTN|nr:MerR family transcriptional regulator [Aeromicrobium marinum]EFQ84478.1 transcriptional regulator, MerR family [Aeromicrobium marinum DSM 15272]
MTAPTTDATTPAEAPLETLSVEQLAARVGMTVRTVRFYAGRGLIPPPRREGRNGYYGPDHLARLELVKELQAHGFTLSAIEGYLEQIAPGTSPEQIALHRTLLAPWMPELPETLTREALEVRAGRRLDDDALELLVALGVIEPTPAEDVFQVAPAHLAVGIGFLEADLPIEAALAARRIMTEHGTALAQELTGLFRDMVWPHLKSSGQPAELMTAMVERFKPLTIQALVTAYEQAVDEEKRQTVRRRT